jgi:hypothetical protein
VRKPAADRDLPIALQTRQVPREEAENRRLPFEYELRFRVRTAEARCLQPGKCRFLSGRIPSRTTRFYGKELVRVSDLKLSGEVVQRTLDLQEELRRRGTGRACRW